MNATAITPDILAAFRQLSADAIQARLTEIDAEASALRVLLRSARAKENAARRQVHPNDKGVNRA